MKLNPTTPIQVDEFRLRHIVAGRNDVAKDIDFIVNSSAYTKPTYGSVDEYGTLISESNTTHVGGGVVRYTRTYIDSVPEPHDEVQEYSLQHDEFPDLPPVYWTYTVSKPLIETVTLGSASSYSGVALTVTRTYEDPDPPEDDDLPEGSELISTHKVPGQWKHDDTPYLNENGTWIVETVNWVLPRIIWTYRYQIDQVTKENLVEKKRIAESNYLLSPQASTVPVPIKVRKFFSYHVLPNGPQPEDLVKATDKTQTYGDTTLGWPRSTDTILEYSTFKKITGCLYQREVTKYLGL